MPLKKILIITDAVTKPLYTPRVRNLYHYFSQKGIEIDWFTEQHEEIPTSFNLKLHQIPFYKHKGILGKTEWIIKNILNLLFDYKNNYFAQKVLSATQNTNYDLVFCSTFHTFGLKAALKVAQKQNIPLHIDLRDIAEQCDTNEYNNSKLALGFISKTYRNINISRRNIILQQANCITTVSPWHVNFIKQFNPNTHLIYNGYDTCTFKPQTIKSNFFDIIYTGKWYGSTLQDPTLLFQALAEINNPQIRLIWYTNTDIHSQISKLANQHNLTSPLVINNYVPNDEIPNLLNQSSIILVLTNKGNRGIMTTKFFEALGVEKPILCVRSDENCLAQTIKETECGLAATNVEDIKEFILYYYNQWQKQGYTHVDVKNKEQFSRQNQALLFEKIFNQVLE
jgi:glycosyltransferase involved in cell wall biosynthesis